jgi:dihydrofolate reductase
MRPIVYFVATSLDGFIARPDGGIDWLFQDQDYGFTEFLAGIDTVVLGRKTYEQTLTFGETAFKGKEVFVFSRTLSHCGLGTVVRQPVDDFAREQKARDGRGIWLVGGGDLAGAFFSARAVDRLIAFVHPVLIHRGLPLAAGVPDDVALRLTDTYAFETGLVRLGYDIVNPGEGPGHEKG